MNYASTVHYLTELNNLHNTGWIKLLVGPIPKTFGGPYFCMPLSGVPL